LNCHYTTLLFIKESGIVYYKQIVKYYFTDMFEIVLLQGIFITFFTNNIK